MNKIDVKIDETDESLYSVNIEVNGHCFKGDEPESFGSKNLGPAPYDFLLASLGECTAITIRWFATQKNWPLEKVSVKLTHQKINKKDHFTKHIIIEGQQLTKEQFDTLYDVGVKCPVHKTLTSDVVIETSR